MSSIHVEEKKNDVSECSARLLHAQVYAVEMDKYGVVSAEGCFWLPVAVSCLVQPMVGDKVLISQASVEAYILAVLTRTKAAQAVISLPDNAQIKVKRGMLTIQASEGIHLATEGALALRANHGVLHTEQMHIHSQRLMTSGAKYCASWQSSNVKIDEQQEHIGQLRQHISQRQTHISGHDELRANSQRLVIAQDWRVRTKSTDLRAQNQMVIDGEKIHLG